MERVMGALSPWEFMGDPMKRDTGGNEGKLRNFGENEGIRVGFEGNCGKLWTDLGGNRSI